MLGGLDAGAFLRRHWQKRPLLARGALPGCGDWLDRNALFEWAARDDVESRLVMCTRNRWSVRHGPFRKADFKRLPARGWTLLVQGVEVLHPQAAALLQCFSFIPHARLDDLMVSYAPPGGGVGPHFDSYDVFLLQGAGTRRWRIGAQRDVTLVDNAPLRILKRFRPEREWRLEQGDLLYLPPRYAHEGVALKPCVTLSVGFRAPRAQELATRFLEFLQDDIQLDGIYQDRDLQPRRHPAALSGELLKRYTRLLRGVRWSANDIRIFCGRYLTEPKPHTVFTPPRRALPLAAFAKRVAAHGLRLAPASRMLFSGGDFFVNGEHQRISAADLTPLQQLADWRRLPACPLAASLARAAHAWYRAGYVEI